MNDDDYIFNLWGKVVSITEGIKYDHVKVTLQLEKDLVAEPMILELPVGCFQLKNFIPGKRIRVVIEKE